MLISSHLVSDTARCPSRRSVVLGLTAAGAAPLGVFAQDEGSPAPAPQDVTFRAFRKDADIGSHAIAFRDEGDALGVDVSIDLKVTFGFLTLYRYTHRATETWRDGRLVRLDTTTDDNGDAFWVRAEADGDALRVEGRDGALTLPGDVLPTSYWRPETPERSLLLDTQRGVPLDVSATDLGRERVPWRGGPAATRRYAVRGDLDLDLWYTDADELAKIAFTARGAAITYAPVV